MQLNTGDCERFNYQFLRELALAFAGGSTVRPRFGALATSRDIQAAAPSFTA
jgi:hypothetical protein